jgi:hypothetical protein
MSKINEWLLGKEQDGEKPFYEPPQPVIKQPENELDYNPLSIDEFEEQWEQL